MKKTLMDYRDFYRRELLEDVMPFWMRSDLLDREYGGCITSVDRAGRSYNDDKSVWFQGRCLWTFSALCRQYGEQKASRDGRPLRKRRYLFSESFYVVGMAEYAAAFGDAGALDKAEACFDLMLRLYREPSSDPYKITPKTYASTREERSAAVPMVLLSSAQVLRRCDPGKAAYYEGVAREIADDLLRIHYQPTLRCVLDTVLPDGSHLDNPAGRTINPGHSCENAWFLMNQAQQTKDRGLLEKALQILVWSLERGWDEKYGGILYFVDVDGRPCEQLEWDMKLWWVHNEALISTLTAYKLTGEDRYWRWFEKVHAYAFGHFPDREQGEWYGYLHRDGSVSHTQKGSMWKGPYHLPRCLMLCDRILTSLAEETELDSLL